jgi:uncharacterized membrane protein YqhA
MLVDQAEIDSVKSDNVTSYVRIVSVFLLSVFVTWSSEQNSKSLISYCTDKYCVVNQGMQVGSLTIKRDLVLGIVF